MRKLSILLIISLLSYGPLAKADGSDSESEGLEILLQAQRDGTIMPLHEILLQVKEITGDEIVEVEFERENGRVKYGIYYMSPKGVRREIYVDAQTGEVIEDRVDN